MSPQLERSHSPKEDISKELAINFSLPSGQEAASSKYKIGYASISQLSPASQVDVMGVRNTSKLMRKCTRAGN